MNNTRTPLSIEAELEAEQYRFEIIRQSLNYFLSSTELIVAANNFGNLGDGETVLTRLENVHLSLLHLPPFLTLEKNEFVLCTLSEVRAVIGRLNDRLAMGN